MQFNSQSLVEYFTSECGNIMLCELPPETLLQKNGDFDLLAKQAGFASIHEALEWYAGYRRTVAEFVRLLENSIPSQEISAVQERSNMRGGWEGKREL